MENLDIFELAKAPIFKNVNQQQQSQQPVSQQVNNNSVSNKVDEIKMVNNDLII